MERSRKKCLWCGNSTNNYYVPDKFIMSYVYKVPKSKEELKRFKNGSVLCYKCYEVIVVRMTRSDRARNFIQESDYESI